MSEQTPVPDAIVVVVGAAVVSGTIVLGTGVVVVSVVIGNSGAIVASVVPAVVPAGIVGGIVGDSGVVGKSTQMK